MTAWNQLSAINCESLEEYNAKFWDALLPVSSFKMVPLAEQIEKYCCGLPKGIKKYCTKTSVMNMAQLMENAEVADDLIQGKPDEDGFKTRHKEPQGKQFSAKGNFTSRLTVPPFKKKPFVGSKPFAGNRPFNTEIIQTSSSFSGQRQGFKRHFTSKTIEERKALRDAKKCYICEEEEHFTNECPQRNSLNKDDKSDRKGKKPKPSPRLVPDLIVNGQRHEHYTFKSDFLMMHGKLCIIKQLRPKVLIECHAPPYAGHRGIDATVKAVDTFFYWPTLRRDVDAFVRSCLVCQKVKFDRQKAPGLLQPLPIPDKPWESIAMDFIFDLPRTPTGNDGIWTIICRFSKQAHFVPIRKKIKSEHMVKLFMHNIFKYHGMPQSLVSDRDPHGRSEEVNSIVLDLLKCYVSEHKATWEHYLPLVEYAYNNTVHTSTGKAPFEIVEGGKKVPPILQTKDKIFEADKYVQNTDEAYRKITLALEKTQSKQKKAADHHRRELVSRWYQMYQDMVPEEQPEVEELDEILVLEQILAHKDRKVKGKIARRYLVKFKNYSPMDAKWMEEAELVDSPQLLQLYLEAFQLQPTVT
ncbi:hypothetical protein L7F22_021817 [Adiantum nelumboides]|nr:hypothetical protein [Adiantum nelumboides]